MKKIIVLFLCMFLSGCVATGPKYSEFKQPFQEGKARIVVFRTGDSGLYAMRSASVGIDDKKIGECPLGSFIYADIPEGQHTIKTEIWDIPGSCEISIKTKAREIYFFLVDPRISGFWAFAGAGLIGAAIETSGKKCGGAFSIYPIDEETAKGKLTNLNLNN